MSLQITKSEQTFAGPAHIGSSERLKVLIPYDGSENTEVALGDLSRAGLPQSLNAIVAVTNVWLPMSHYEISRAVSARRMRVLNAGTSSFVPALRDYEEQRVLSFEAERRIRSIFPSGTVKAEAMHDTAVIANESLRKAKQWGTELIIVGSNTSPSPHITDYAGPALRVAREAHCSVRIARASARVPVQKDEAPVRIIIAVDGLDPATVVQAVADRVWPPSSDVRLVTVLQSGPRKDSETTLMSQPAEELRAKGLTVSIATRDGEPADVLLQEAREFAADCIFIDSRGLTRDLNDGTDLGKAAAGLILGAHCSVEVVRTKNFGGPYLLKPAA